MKVTLQIVHLNYFVNITERCEHRKTDKLKK